MFTGLIEEIGVIASATTKTLVLRAPRIATEVRVGESVAVNGCCLSAISQHRELLTFDLLAETLARTNLRALSSGDEVNLERALRADARVGGHFVQGHVDDVARIISFEKQGADYRLEVGLKVSQAHLVEEKGSIAVDGVSLTVAEVHPESFVAWIIPHTLAQTGFRRARAGRLVNLEFDILAKYVARHVPSRNRPLSPSRAERSEAEGCGNSEL
jgi:riboflavin synthase